MCGYDHQDIPEPTSKNTQKNAIELERIRHPCQKYMGKGPGCSKCKILLHGYCQEWFKVIPNLGNHLQYKYYNLLDEDEIQIIIAETFDGILRSIDNFQKESKPETWIRQICNNKRFDFLKKKLKQLNSVGELIPCVPDELTKICNQWSDDIAFFASKKTGILKILSEASEEQVQPALKALQSLSKRPSWLNAIQRLCKNRTINLYKHPSAADLQECCDKFPEILHYQAVDEPTGTLYALSPPLGSELMGALLSISKRPDWQDAIRSLDRRATKAGSRIVIQPLGGAREEDDGEDRNDDIPDPGSNFLEPIDDKIAIEQIILQIEKINPACAKIFSDWLENEREKQMSPLEKKLKNTTGKTMSDQQHGRDATVDYDSDAFRKKWSRCLRMLFIHPDKQGQIIVPGDQFSVNKIEAGAQQQKDFLWCTLDNGTRIRSEKKLSPDELAAFQKRDQANKKVRITGFKATSSGNDYFPVYDIPRERHA
ncbi:MAG: hypothetical protein Q4G66_12255 [bacterium]|nr:hypothetical protein [bacterium]